MHLLVVRPTDEPGAQGGGEAFEGRAVSGTDAPGTAQYQCHCRMGFEHRFQDRNPLEQGMSCRLIRAHVDTLAGMPEHFFMMDNSIEVQVEHHVRAARSGRWEVGCVLAGRHGAQC